MSESNKLDCRVPYGCVLEPLLFTLLLLVIFLLCTMLALIIIQMTPKFSSAFDLKSICQAYWFRVWPRWLTISSLLKPDNTEFLLLGTLSQLRKIDLLSVCLSFSNSLIRSSHCACNLVIISESCLSFLKLLDSVIMLTVTYRTYQESDTLSSFQLSILWLMPWYLSSGLLHLALQWIF